MDEGCFLISFLSKRNKIIGSTNNPQSSDIKVWLSHLHLLRQLFCEPSIRVRLISASVFTFTFIDNNVFYNTV